MICLGGLYIVPSYSEPLLPLFRASLTESVVAEKANGRAAPILSEQVSIQSDTDGMRYATLKRGAKFTYDATGNLYAERGTLAFFWRLKEKPVPEFYVLKVSTAEWHWWTIFLVLRQNGKQMQIIDRNRKKTTLNTIAKVERNRWYHIVFSWDPIRGVAVYVDGKKTGEDSTTFFTCVELDQIGLGCMTHPSYDAYGSEREMDFREIRTYAQALTEEQVFALSVGKEPQGKTEVFSTDTLEQYSWQDTSHLPSVVLDPASPAMEIRSISFRDAQDGKFVYTATDGKQGTIWPKDYHVFPEGGKQLLLEMDGKPRVNWVTVTGKFKGVIESLTPTKETLLEKSEDSPFTLRRLFQEPREIFNIAVNREEGKIHELNLYWVGNSTGNNAPSVSQPLTCSLLSAEQKEIVNWLGQNLTTLQSVPYQSSPEVITGQRFALIWPETEVAIPVDKLELELVLDHPLPTGLCHVSIKDPFCPTRNLIFSDFALKGGTERDRIHLVFDIRNIILPAQSRLYGIFVFDRAVSIRMSQSRLSLIPTSLENALDEYIPDEKFLMRDLFQFMSEPHPWSRGNQERMLEACRWWRELWTRTVRLKNLAPQDEIISAYYHWMSQKSEPLLEHLPEVPKGIPPWTFYYWENLRKFKKMAYWWVDKRQTEQGPFGSDYDDDTVLIQDWPQLVLLDGPDPKLVESLKKIANYCWTQGPIKDGLNVRVLDALHAYEEGINAQAGVLLVDYGNPVYLTRLMETVRSVEKNLLITNSKNHYHFRSNWYGAGNVLTQDRYGWDESINALMLEPAVYLAWYNGNSRASEIVIKWGRALLEDWKRAGSPPEGLGYVNPETCVLEQKGGWTYNIFFNLAWFCYDKTKDSEFLEPLKKAFQASDRHSLYRLLPHYAVYKQATGDPSRDTMILHESERYDPLKTRFWNGWPTSLLCYCAWKITADEDWFDKSMISVLANMTCFIPMLTIADPSADRVPLPMEALAEMSLGGIARNRNSIYPRHAVSWEQQQGQIVPLVLESDLDHLKILVYNISNQSARPVMRIWKLEPGVYRITETMNKGSATIQTREKKLNLHRYSAVNLELPPLTKTTIEIRQLQKLRPLSELPDLAICREDTSCDVLHDFLTIVVHNVGNTRSPATTVCISDEKGKSLTVCQIPPIEAPLDLQPRYKVIKIPKVRNGFYSRELVIVVDPNDKIEEITKNNNSLSLKLPEKGENEAKKMELK